MNDREFRKHLQEIAHGERGFRVPLSIPDTIQSEPEIWVSLHAVPELLGSPGDPSFPLEIIGRTRPGASIAETEGRLNAIAKQVFNSIPAAGDTANVTELNAVRDVETEFVRTPLFLLSATSVSGTRRRSCSRLD